MKMMKRSKMTVLLSALLCAVLLLSSCGTSAAIPADDEETVSLPASEMISSVSSGASAAPSLDSTTAGDDGEELTMSEALAVWKEYLLYDEHESATVGTRVFNMESDSGVNFALTMNNRIAEYTVIVDDDALDFALTYYGVERNHVYYELVDLWTGKTIQSFDYSRAAVANNEPWYSVAIISIASDFEIARVTKVTYTPVYENETPAEGEAPLYYDAVYEVTFYAPDGTVLASGKNGEHSVVPNYLGYDYSIFSLAGKSYTVVDGEIVATCAEGMYTLPLVGWDLEYNGYRYWIDDNYGEITVTDKASNVVVRYQGGWDEYYILSDGNIYLYNWSRYDEYVLEYSYYYYDSKCLIQHTLIDVETGAVTHPDLGFAVMELITNANAENNNGVKEGLNIASVYRYADGKMDTLPTNLVLDGDMNVVATLPNVVPNQSGLLTRMGGDSWKLDTTVGNYTTVSYLISSYGNLVLLPCDEDITQLCNGFFVMGGDIYAYSPTAEPYVVIDGEDLVQYRVFNGGNSLAILDDESVLTVYTLKPDGGITSNYGVHNVASLGYTYLDGAVLRFSYQSSSNTRPDFVDSTGRVLCSTELVSLPRYSVTSRDNYIILAEETINGHTSYVNVRSVLIYVK